MRDRAMTPRLPSQLREAPRDRAASQSRAISRMQPRPTAHAPPRTAAHAPSRTAAREQSRNRSRGQSGLFMRMQKTPSKAL